MRWIRHFFERHVQDSDTALLDVKPLLIGPRSLVGTVEFDRVRGRWE